MRRALGWPHAIQEVERGHDDNRRCVTCPEVGASLLPARRPRDVHGRSSAKLSVCRSESIDPPCCYL